MRVELAVSGQSFLLFGLPIFLTLLTLFKASFPTAALLSLLLPAVQLRLSMGWCYAIFLAVVAWLSFAASQDQMGIMAGKFFRDMAYSRSMTLAYRYLGEVLDFADEGGPLEPLPMLSTRGSPIKVAVVQTAKNTGARLKSLEPLFLFKNRPKRGEPHLFVSRRMRYQTIAGFGGSFTESSADTLLKMSPAKQELILNAYFNKESGLGFRIGRLHMNSCDFSKGNWSCVDTPGDLELRSFSIERYRASILPMVRRAQAALGEPLTLIASPWSPPAWMKDNQRMLNGGRLLPQYREAWAKFYVKFAKALQEEGINLFGFTVQNEPQAETPWENCLYTHEEERDFVGGFLGPALKGSGMDLKLLVWDHNRDDMFARARAIYEDPTAAQYVWGVGYHWYGDPRHEVWPAREGMLLHDNLLRVHELKPEGHIWMTEACQEFGPRIGAWSHGERYGEALIRDFNRWLEAWVDWNFLLDETGGPNHVGNLVSAPVIADVKRDRVLFLSIYYYLGHFSRFVQPGATRVAAVANRDLLESVAFEHPDGKIVVVVMNQQDYAQSFWLEFEEHVQHVTVPEHSISTFLF